MKSSLRCGFSAWLLLAGSSALLQAQPLTHAQRTVQDALQAEAQADNKERAKLLREAIDLDPQLAAARWQSGYVRLDDCWLSPEQAAEKLAADGRVTEYLRLRNSLAEGLDSHLLLARFCQKAKLTDREQMHWRYVLQAQPKNEQARRALGVREYQGQLLTDEQIDADKQQQKLVAALDAQWQPRVQMWREKLTGESGAERAAAFAELQAITDLDAIPYLEAEFSEASETAGLAVVKLLSKHSAQTATASLARHAVLSSYPEVRKSAAEALKERPWQTFVPGLLANMQAPLELSYYVNTLGGSGFTYAISLVSEGVTTTQQHIQSGALAISVTAESQSGRLPRRATGHAPRAIQTQIGLNKLAAKINGVERSLQQANGQTDALNLRIQATLTIATGKELSADPHAWWNWWTSYNESYVYRTRETTNDDYNEVKHFHFRVSQFSCFLKGTPVWTELGLVPIERVRPGDRVLSQHPETGELTYQLVMQTTVRPPAKSLWVRLGDDEILATLGHPFWVLGQGWKMTKELEVGQHLHTPTGAIAIDKLEPGATAEAYNLVLADFGTYFVGRSKVLVHDNTPWIYTTAPVPGAVVKP